MSTVMGMLDIETLGTEPAGAAIATVGLVAFTRTEILDRGYWKLDLRWTPGRRDRDTYDWWMKQDPLAMEEAFRHRDEMRALPWDVCAAISEFAATTNMKLIWAYPARFDVGHLRELYYAVGHTFPLEFWRERDMTTLMRTAYDINPHLESRVKEIKAQNRAAHNALEDALTQAKIVQFLLESLNCEMQDPQKRTYEPAKSQ